METMEERFFKNQPTQSLTFEGKESPQAEFGYKVRRGNEIFTIVDWGNIKSFIHSELKLQAQQIIESIPDNNIQPNAPIVLNDQLKAYLTTKYLGGQNEK